MSELNYGDVALRVVRVYLLGITGFAMLGFAACTGTISPVATTLPADCQAADTVVLRATADVKKLTAADRAIVDPLVAQSRADCQPPLPSDATVMTNLSAEVRANSAKISSILSSAEARP